MSWLPYCLHFRLHLSVCYIICVYVRVLPADPSPLEPNLLIPLKKAQTFRKSTRSFSVPSPQGGIHIPSARVNPLVHVTPAKGTSTSDEATSRGDKTESSRLLLPSANDAKGLMLSTKSLPGATAQTTATPSTAELVSSSLELALAQIMKGVVSKMAADMQSQTLAAVERTSTSAGVDDAPLTDDSRSPPSSPASLLKKNVVETPSTPTPLSKKDAGVQTDRPTTKNVAINTPRPPTPKLLQPPMPGALHKTKSETTLNQIGVATSPGQRSSVQRPRTLMLPSPQSPFQRGQSFQGSTDMDVVTGESARLSQYPGSLDLTKVGVEPSSPTVPLASSFTSGLSRTKSCVDISHLGMSAPPTPTSGMHSSVRNFPSGGCLPNANLSHLSPGDSQLSTNLGGLHRARSFWDVYHPRTASAGDVPVSQLAQRRSAAVTDEMTRDRPASVSDMSQLGFVPKPKRALDLGRAVPFGQFLVRRICGDGVGKGRI